MRNWLSILCMLLGSVGAWGASERFQFISTLSAPIGSFNEVHTANCERPVSLTGMFNVGSKQSTGGLLVLDGGAKALDVSGALRMEDNTVLSFPSKAKWLVGGLNTGDGLYIGGLGSVSVRSLIANTITLPEGKTTNLTTTYARIPSITTTKAIIRTQLQTTDSPLFLFNYNSSITTTTNTAQWSSLALSSIETELQNNGRLPSNLNKFYPLYFNP